jgi:hypothetical protein
VTAGSQALCPPVRRRPTFARFVPRPSAASSRRVRRAALRGPDLPRPHRRLQERALALELPAHRML